MILWVLVVTFTQPCVGDCSSYHWPTREDGLFTSEQACDDVGFERYGRTPEWTCQPFSDKPTEGRQP